MLFLTVASDAAETAKSLIDHDDFWLITIPTVLLTIATLWDNDRMFRIASRAIDALGIKRKKEAAEAIETHQGEFHESKHELHMDVDNTVANLVKDTEALLTGKKRDTPKLAQDEE